MHGEEMVLNLNSLSTEMSFVAKPANAKEK